MTYIYRVPAESDRVVVVQDLRKEELFGIPLSEFRLEPASGVYRERHLVTDHLGFRVSIPIVMELDMDGYINGAKDNLETAIRILETENPLKSKKVVDGRLVEDEPV